MAPICRAAILAAVRRHWGDALPVLRPAARLRSVLVLGRTLFRHHFVRTELVTILKRKATKIIAELEAHEDPVLITQRGKPAAYLVAVEKYDSLRKRLAILEGIARGERAIEDGRVVSHAEAKKRMARWLS